MEKRFKLTTRQFDSLKDVNKRIDALKLALTTESRHLETISQLILEFLTVSPELPMRVDSETQEIVVVLPDPKPAE